ncbi:MAG: tetratricopeptide repeat protein [Desulfonauticus sp.]|nr:tetratricopeptide repeat protein [Desulfonauticus sp.]
MIRKEIFLITVFAFSFMFIASLNYRINNPKLTLTFRTEPTMPDNSMSGIVELMQKLSKNPEDIDTLKELGTIFMQMKAWDRALSFWNRILKLQPKNRMALSQSAYCYFQLSQYKKAADYYEMVLLLDRNNKDNYIINYNLGLIYFKFLKDKIKAKRYFQQVLASSTADSSLKKEVKKILSQISN